MNRLTGCLMGRSPRAAAGKFVWVVALLGMGLTGWAQTDGNARFQGTLTDYVGSSGTSHYTVAWVTTGDGAFIKTLRKQGPMSWTDPDWANHCGYWNTARAGSTAIDGYTSATASNYSGTNSPVILNWNCRNASGVVVPDGPYKFWVQYAENAGQGPYTTNGMEWTKGPAPFSSTYTNQRVTNMRVDWTPASPPPTPRITSVRVLGDQLVMAGTGAVSRTCYVLESGTPTGQWTSIATNAFDGSGNWGFTNPVSAGPGRYYRLLLP